MVVGLVGIHLLTPLDHRASESRQVRDGERTDNVAEVSSSTPFASRVASSRRSSRRLVAAVLGRRNPGGGRG